MVQAIPNLAVDKIMVRKKKTGRQVLASHHNSSDTNEQLIDGGSGETTVLSGGPEDLKKAFLLEEVVNSANGVTDERASLSPYSRN